MLSKLLVQLAALVMASHFHLKEYCRTNCSYLLDIWQLNFLKVNKVNLSLVAQIAESACIVGDPGVIPGLGRCPGEGNGNPLQYSCLESPGSLVDYSPWGHKG